MQHFNEFSINILVEFIKTIYNTSFFQFQWVRLIYILLGENKLELTKDVYLYNDNIMLAS